MGFCLNTIQNKTFKTKINHCKSYKVNSFIATWTLKLWKWILMTCHKLF